MGLTLYLVRHAQANKPEYGQKDFFRELSQQGAMDAPRMGVKLRELGVLPDEIKCSSATRTTQTCNYLNEQLKLKEEQISFEDDLYEASTRTLLNVINSISDSLKSCMIIGHNPSMTYISEYLTNKEIGDIETCGCLKLSIDVDSWSLISKNSATLDWYIYP